MIITLDGPTASGKSSIAQLLAQRNNWYHLNTGLLYRAVGYILIHHYKYSQSLLHNPSMEHLRVITKLESLSYHYDSQHGGQVFFNVEAITQHLKTPEIDKAASIVSSNNNVRLILLEFQRSLGKHHTLVTDGRDCGTVLFPHAEYKFFITASETIRAQRWQQAQRTRGLFLSLEECLTTLQERDVRDSSREHAPLKPANDAHHIDTTNLNLNDIILIIEDIINSLKQKENYDFSTTITSL